MLAEDSCVEPSRNWGSREALRGESRREQQFNRYYGPFHHMSAYGPKFCDVRQPEARAMHEPVTSPDKILTAFCQLGALRLMARRCMVFFFDINHAYVMAEATQTLSLESGAHEPGDELWLGHAVIPREVACCEITVDLPCNLASAATDVDVLTNAFVVNDLTKHPDLSTRPYVTGDPNGRFYAGVPITTPDGINIGAYCILDDKVRDGLSKQDLNFLADMSRTVMTHIETVRALFERHQSNRMVAGIGNFVRGASDVEQKPATSMSLDGHIGRSQLPRAVQHRLPDSLLDTVVIPASKRTLFTGQDDFVATDQPKQPSGPSKDLESLTVPEEKANDWAEAASANNWNNSFLDHQMRSTTWATSLTTPLAEPRDSHRHVPRWEDEGEQVKRIYQRAAQIMCSSLDLDGVAFLDASVGVFGGLTAARRSESTDGSSGESDDAASASLNLGSHSTADNLRASHGRPCQVLGYAQTTRPGTDLLVDRAAENLTESRLRGLLRRNPDGHIWVFDENLKLQSEDGFSSDDTGANEPVRTARSLSNLDRETARRQRRSDGETLQSAFPGARCIALHGVWDHTRKRWSVGSLFWTFDPLRCIAQDTEMNFVAAFCDVILAETRRIEVLSSDKAKTDFISSVSHELRSPLHGILGSSEVMSSLDLDSTASALVEQITSCGNTLLEVIDHLLDFADLKSQRLRKGAIRSSRIGRDSLHPIPRFSADTDIRSLDIGAELDDLTEDAIITSVHSFYYSQDAAGRTYIPVILDIDRSPEHPWRCGLATGGWKRICMNLVTNSLKYTSSGFIRVSLQQKFKPGSRRRFDAVLSVADSGKGMSKEFQQNHLFNDFSQEDTLSSGLGLGLHMVSRIVHAMGGKIEVMSNQEGTGTRITVRVPLQYRQSGQERDDSKVKERNSSTPKTFDSLIIGLVVGLDSLPITREDALSATASAMTLASIEKICRFLGSQVETCQWRVDDAYDLKIIQEAELATILASLRNSTTAAESGSRHRHVPSPMIVVCSHSPGAQKLRSMWMKDELRHRVAVEYIALPCGMKQIARVIASALHLHKKHIAGVSAGPLQHDELSRATCIEDASTALKSRICSQPETESPRLLPSQSDKLAVEQAGYSLTLPLSTAVRVKPEPLLPRTTGLIAPPLAIAPSAPSVPRVGRTPMLLLVDDNEINLRLLATFAKKRGYPHVTAVDGQLAVDAFKSAHRNNGTARGDTSEATDSNPVESVMVPNIIFMDINMPVMDGYEAVQRIRAYEKRHHMHASTIVAVTALQSEAAQVEAFGSGFDLFLSKPVTMKDLTLLVERLRSGEWEHR